MSIRFVSLATDLVASWRAGGPDANGQTPELQVAPENGYPCRHCLDDIQAGERFLVLAHRPFPRPQPYAEVGPIFIHAASCPRGGGTAAIPAFLDSPHYIVRGYGADDRIVYGSGGVVATGEIPATAVRLLADARIVYAHVRSASNNCFHCRIERA